MPVQDIFIQGRLEMSAVPLPEGAAEILWRDTDINRLLTVIAVLIGIAGIRELFRLMPALAFTFSRTRATVSLEYNTSMVRTRNSAALACILPFCLVADRFGLLRPEIWSAVPAEWSVAATAGVMLAYLLLRSMCAAAIRLPRMDSLSEAAVHRAPWNYFILLTILMLATAGILPAAGADDRLTRLVLYVEAALLYLLSLVRTGQILAGSFSGLSTILYLCGLELLPTAALAACAIFL